MCMINITRVWERLFQYFCKQTRFYTGSIWKPAIFKVEHGFGKRGNTEEAPEKVSYQTLFKSNFSNVPYLVTLTENPVGLLFYCCVNDRYVFSLASTSCGERSNVRTGCLCRGKLPQSTASNARRRSASGNLNQELLVVWIIVHFLFRLAIITGTHTQASNFLKPAVSGLQHAVCVWPSIFPISTGFQTQDGHWLLGYSALC